MDGGRGRFRLLILLGALAMMVGSDPFHDVFLLSSYAGWVLVGRGFAALSAADEGTRRVDRPQEEHHRTGSATRH